MCKSIRTKYLKHIRMLDYNKRKITPINNMQHANKLEWVSTLKNKKSLTNTIMHLISPVIKEIH